MGIVTTVKPYATPRQRMRAFADCFLTGKVLFIVYVVGAVLATLSKVLLKDIPYHGTVYHITHYPQLIVFGVYRAGFFHLLHHQDLYAVFPLQAPPDIFKYSPAFALFMAPFALLPYAVGAILWNLLNAVALFAGVWAVPRVSDRGKALILWFVLLRMIENAQNAQSDALVAGLMLGAWAAMEREKPLLSSFCIMSSVFIKLFGVLALLPALMIGSSGCWEPKQWLNIWRNQWRQHWGKLFGYLVMWMALLATAPMLMVGPRQLLFLYRSWYARLTVDAESYTGISVAALLQRYHLPVPRTYVLVAGAIILLLVFLSRTDAFGDFGFRILAISSVMIFAVIFNHMSESSSMIIAATGVAVWYFLSAGPSGAALPFQPALDERSDSPSGRSSDHSAPTSSQRFAASSSLNSIVNGILLALVFVFTVLWPTAIVPGTLRRHVMRGNTLVFSIPCMLVWLKLQYDLLRFPRSSCSRDARA